ncbi:hypothetical protein AM493_05040 [Flavobacterium akiainvivens]|uniref:Leucine-rich repeat domain-containing protein n=1 Tax=Flavobacterium akiainvivens TaxID=1202724 RepID=A0A0M8MBU3_9FLAO|nr:leucine-rich repeat domain-containing protein [Flavobacterium akiainvivens]KOS05464.1 hypothetical protein AM493_05040 [Flavobacterium akiainvivens]SFQ32505.1 hypothetical protein SAMN05444144_10342 [Flavobacterium akiainvivens]
MTVRFILPLLLFFAVSNAQCIKCEALSEALKAPEQVKSLAVNGNLSGEEFDEFPKDVFKLRNIEELYITDYGFYEIPRQIGNLKKIKSLSLAGNSLEVLPDEIFTLTNLTELILSDNLFSDEYIEYIKQTVKEKLPKTRLMID